MHVWHRRLRRWDSAPERAGLPLLLILPFGFAVAYCLPQAPACRGWPMALNLALNHQSITNQKFATSSSRVPPIPGMGGEEGSCGLPERISLRVRVNHLLQDQGTEVQIEALCGRERKREPAAEIPCGAVGLSRSARVNEVQPTGSPQAKSRADRGLRRAGGI